ncbi:hypothetical protein, partial [Armatimonas sp.]|uniref:hypothetical protein n=1 Tax=Armatimonas sp. TaxID=1872638 RepID=UPI00375195DC
VVICLSDNDLLIHLAAWNLLSEFQALLQDKFSITASDIYVLDSFVRQLQTNKKWESQYGQNVLGRAERFCTSLPRVYSLPYDRPTVIALSEVDDIDEGEAVLIAVALQHPDSMILTNELRFLGALASGDPVCVPYCAALQGRILHLRQIVEELLEQKGFRHLESCIKPRSNSDTRIFRAFQGSADAARSAMREAVREVERLGPGLLIPLREDTWS